jgi:hypothetical protein
LGICEGEGERRKGDEERSRGFGVGYFVFFFHGSDLDWRIWSEGKGVSRPSLFFEDITFHFGTHLRLLMTDVEDLTLTIADPH